MLVLFKQLTIPRKNISDQLILCNAKWVVRKEAQREQYIQYYLIELNGWKHVVRTMNDSNPS